MQTLKILFFIALLVFFTNGKSIKYTQEVGFDCYRLSYVKFYSLFKKISYLNGSKIKDLTSKDASLGSVVDGIAFEIDLDIVDSVLFLKYSGYTFNESSFFLDSYNEIYCNKYFTPYLEKLGYRNTLSEEFNRPSEYCNLISNRSDNKRILLLQYYSFLKLLSLRDDNFKDYFTKVDTSLIYIESLVNKNDSSIVSKMDSLLIASAQYDARSSFRYYELYIEDGMYTSRLLEDCYRKSFMNIEIVKLIVSPQ